jgi:hypothetical protein
MISREFRQVLINVKNDRDRDNQGNRINIGANELLNDIPVHPLDVLEGVQFLQGSKSFPWQTLEPLHQRMQQDEQS